uniref:Chemokine (C motif) receptor 1b, duplicate 1 n=1 Tax=Astatotilapia calliptera TaxID=8154 RepID=A0A3P8PVD1_ASTCA
SFLLDTMDSTLYNYDDYYDFTWDYDYDSYELCNKTSVIQFGAIFTLVFFSIVVILSIFANILVLVVLVKFENLKSLTNTFILNLAVSDLFFTASLPFWAYYNMHGWTLGDSGILLILMTAHCYESNLKPLSDIISRYINNKLLLLLVSVLLSSLAFAASKVSESKYCVYADSFGSLWGIYQRNILFLITSVVFMFCHTHIMLIFLQSFSYWPRESDSLGEDCQYSKNLDYALEITRLFAFSQCCLNPVFYVFVGVKVKSHLKNLIKISGPPKNNNNSFRSRQNQLTVTSLTNAEELSVVP